MSSRSNSGLMLVDNPKRLFRSLCSLQEKDFSGEEYLPLLGALTKKGTVHTKTKDTYFYTATILKLVKETAPNSHRYIVTPLCRKICDVIDDPKSAATYRKYLKGLLLSNSDKGPLFKKFLKFTSKPKKIVEIEKEFGKVPTKTLVAFCREAGLLVKYGDSVKSVVTSKKENIADFYKVLLRNYVNLRDDPRRNVQMIYTPIDLIRDMVCLDLGLESHEVFDKLLSTILESTLGQSIYIHGAPPQSQDDFLGFFYNGKRYAYISMRVEQTIGEEK